jgi:hypothetical protein
VLLEAMNAGGVVKEDVGVQNEGLGADRGFGVGGRTFTAGGGVYWVAANGAVGRMVKE